MENKMDCNDSSYVCRICKRKEKKLYIMCDICKKRYNVNSIYKHFKSKIHIKNDNKLQIDNDKSDTTLIFDE